MADIVSIDYPEIDLCQEAALRERIRACAPQILVNAAAYTAVDRAETEEELCTRINGRAPVVMAEEVKRLGALLVHYSTDYVFDGTKREPYHENDVPNPLGAYGRSKLTADRGIQKTGCDHLIFRLCWVYGARGQNFLRTIRRLAGERQVLRVVCDQVGCPTWSRMIAETTAYALQHAWSSGKPSTFNGVYHLAAGDSTSWHGFAEAIVGLMPDQEKACKEIQAITTPEYPTPAKRPAYSVLDCQKLKKTFGLQLPGWKESLAQVCEL